MVAIDPRDLGKSTDRATALSLGKTEHYISRVRRHLGIPRFNPQAWSDEELSLLGTIPDAEVSRRTGRTIRAVLQKRLKLGIANSNENDRRRKTQ